FEKMAYDNSELLKNYVHAFQTFVEPEAARVARETIRWMDEWLSDRERGGFYASQDADFSLEDDGDYFTWTLDEAAAVLMPEEMAFALKSLDRVLAEARDSKTGLAHVVAYGEHGGVEAQVSGVLDDYVFLGHAALDAWEMTGEMKYYIAAESIMGSALERFY